MGAREDGDTPELDALTARVESLSEDVAALREWARESGEEGDAREARAVAAEARWDAGLRALQEAARRSRDRADAGERREVRAGRRLDALEASVAIDRELILELQEEGLVSREHAANLEAALQTSRMIGAAVGIIMAFYGVTEASAFELLRRASNDQNVKLRAVAEEVVLTGSTTGLPPRST